MRDYRVGINDVIRSCIYSSVKSIVFTIRTDKLYIFLYINKYCLLVLRALSLAKNTGHIYVGYIVML